MDKYYHLLLVSDAIMVSNKCLVTIKEVMVIVKTGYRVTMVTCYAMTMKKLL